ncbi:MAG TPA: hypothetical protein DHU79_02955 [Clostridiales bacterium]|jgi:hypothetical protein|nr:hypothetical protein [Clostridiales bacterium]
MVDDFNTEFIPDFILYADNVYRTKEFIVKQQLSIIRKDGYEVPVLLSTDTFYKRTKYRDYQYDIMYDDREIPEGKRLPSTSYTRKYIY